MHLILMRHAQAEPAGGMETDGERVLTPAGMRDAEAVGAMLAGFDLPRPPRVLASPKTRAAETARIVARGLGAAEPELLDVLRGDHSLDDILRALSPHEAACLVVVGHMPDLGQLTARLIDPMETGTARIPPAGFVWLELGRLPPEEPARVRRVGGPDRGV